MARFEGVQPVHEEMSDIIVLWPIWPAVLIGHFNNLLLFFSLNALCPLLALLLSSHVFDFPLLSCLIYALREYN